jgi:hypothetical protein
MVMRVARVPIRAGLWGALLFVYGCSAILGIGDPTVASDGGVATLRDPLRNFDKNVWGWESILFASRSTRDDGNKRDGRGAM